MKFQSKPMWFRRLLKKARLAPREFELMTQNSNNNAKENEIRLPDDLLKQVE
jgi:hypothetical protein